MDVSGIVVSGIAVSGIVVRGIVMRGIVVSGIVVREAVVKPDGVEAWGYWVRRSCGGREGCLWCARFWRLGVL